MTTSATAPRTLFAALNMLDGTVIGKCMPRHRHREFLRFLKTIDQRTLPHLDLHLIVDNYATHKTPAVKRWLKRHPRFHLHFTPTSGSWLNMVERFFAEKQAHQTRCLQERRRIEASHHGLSRQPQRPSQAIRLEQDCRRNLQ